MPGRPAFFDSPVMAPAMRAFSVAHVALFQGTGGRVGRRFRFGSAFPRGVPVCLLTVRGRKTGKPRTVPLVYLPEGGSVVLVASRGGTGLHPQWLLNLLAEPSVTVRTGGRPQRMLARVAEGDDRAELWRRLVEMYPEYGSYQSWTDRTIPVVVCEPAP